MFQRGGKKLTKTFQNAQAKRGKTKFAFKRMKFLPDNPTAQDKREQKFEKKLNSIELKTMELHNASTPKSQKQTG